METIDEEFLHLLQGIEGAKSASIDFKRVVEDVLAFIIRLKEELTQAMDVTAKAELLRKVQEMYRQLAKLVATFAETIGVSEQTLLSYADNPAYFTDEDWKLLWDARHPIATAAKEMFDAVYQRASVSSEKILKKGKKSPWIKS